MKPAAWLLGAGECTTHKTITYAPSLDDTAIKPAADKAFAQSGVTRSQIQLASLYDCYTITVLVTLEEAGFCPRGGGGRFDWLFAAILGLLASRRARLAFARAAGAPA